MGLLYGATYVATVLLLTEMATVASIPQHQVGNRIVNQPQGSLLVPIRQDHGNNAGQVQPSFQQQNFLVSQSAGVPSRDPQAQNHQNIPNNTRLPRPSQQDSFFQQGETSRPSNSQTNTGRPQSSSQGFESNMAPARKEKDSSCGKFPSPGQCQAAFPRYYYNASMSQCECYLFGGCDEAEGSYRTLEDCHLMCLPERKEEGPSCKHVYIDNFHPPENTSPPTFPIIPSGTQAPSSRPSGGNGQTQPSDGNRPVFNTPEHARPQADIPQGNRNPNSDSGVHRPPNSNFGAPNFNTGSPNINNGRPDINVGMPNFNTGSPNFNIGSPNVNSGSPNFNNAPSNVNSGSPNFNNGSPNVNLGSPNFNNAPSNVNSGSPNFNHRSPNVNSGSPNFNIAPSNVNSGSSNFNSGLPNINSGSPNFNNGLPNMNSGSPNVNSGSPHFNIGSPNVNSGTPNFNNGSPNVNSGTPNFNTGSPNFNNGRPDVNVGTPNFNNAPSNVNSGSPNFNNGSPNVNSGSPNFNNAPSNVNSVSPNFNNGSPNVNSGTPNFNTGSPNFNNGRPDMNVGTPDFNNGPSDSNKGSPNFNNGSPNVNNGQRIPTPSNGRPVSNEPSRDTQVILSTPGMFLPIFPSSPGNKLLSSNPVIPVIFPVLESVSVPIFPQNSGSRQTF